jgi:hypothetical protein
MANRIPDKGADQGGMTGATGSLTPDTAGDDFIPAETRELTEPKRARLSEPAQQLDRRQPEAGTILGGDERRDPEDEHL